MGFLNLEERAAKELFSGAAMRTFWGDKMMVSRVDFAAGVVVPDHSHPHEQVGILLSGELTLTIDGEQRTLRAGDMYIVPGGVIHGGVAGDEGFTAFEVFSPVREEYKY